ncbi:kinase-like domain-containing protein [Glomus cerebriforme]|uniref:Kinase-like domain-containing protein n=1 Tax=Glomus cerebriforme TaxID=658196 RepID=A0A397TH38_9GLOM|nr:kinase-like domain-containing protein [Glomus cerebriforme]
MSAIRIELIKPAIDRAIFLGGYNFPNDIDKRFELIQQMVIADIPLITEDEKTEAIKEINKVYDKNKILQNKGKKRICENCDQECLATLYCEYCVRNYLKANFSNWTSGNNDNDNLIQKCQLESNEPDVVIEWIPYNNLQNIKYLTKGGCSEIYTAGWIDGAYYEWDSKEKQLKRFGNQVVVLKSLENVENVNKRWFEEALNFIHAENAIHRDLHSGNILFKQINSRFLISDLGFCGPVDKPSSNIYGNLSYIAPEVIVGKQTTFASDIYSIAMLMWEISSGQPPFINYEHDYDLAMNIINAFHSKSYDEFNIPDNIDDFDKLNNQKNNSASKKISSKIEDHQNDYNNVGTMQHHTYIDDDKEDVHNNSNLHSEEQNDLEITEAIKALQQTLNSNNLQAHKNLIIYEDY